MNGIDWTARLCEMLEKCATLEQRAWAKIVAEQASGRSLIDVVEGCDDLLHASATAALARDAQEALAHGVGSFGAFLHDLEGRRRDAATALPASSFLGKATRAARLRAMRDLLTDFRPLAEMAASDSERGGSTT
jgi:hypothetical protein